MTPLCLILTDYRRLVLFMQPAPLSPVLWTGGNLELTESRLRKAGDRRAGGFVPPIEGKEKEPSVLSLKPPR